MERCVDDPIGRLLESPSYALAFEDHDFVMAHDQRPVRLQLELQKPEAILRQHKIRFTIVVFGGTRIIEPAVAKARLTELQAEIARDGSDPARARRLAIAERVVAKAKYYEEAREFSRLVAESYRRDESEYVVVTGGGPGVMEAANRGAWEVGAPSIGLNITLPMEQLPNSYITPSLCFQFHYFAVRKMHFLLRAQALVAFPGGYGTLDELFEALTLMQTGKTRVMPVILFGREFWDGVVDFQYLADEGTISDQDLQLFHFAETAAEAWEIIRAFHASKPRYGRGTSTRELRRREDAREPDEPTPTA
jgi:uncharacterized protein (TIGR00730 family)